MVLFALAFDAISAELTSTRDPLMQSVAPPLKSNKLEQRQSMRLFISGHSLTDQPIPNQLSAIARSLGTPLEWNRQYVVGSSIAKRTRGNDPRNVTWSGYRTGSNRSGEGLDVVSELLTPKTIAGGKYDTLLITEQHGLLDTLLWNDTVRHLRHYHDRLIDGNPYAKTYFYESWISLDNKNDPRRWIAYERAASPIWQCIATRINISLDTEGRSDRITSLPAGAALADLIDDAIGLQGVPGITLGSVRETVDSIIADNVHLTELGSYYIALVSYAVTFGRSPEGAWHPIGLNDAQIKSLQRKAWDFVSKYARTNTPLSLNECLIELKSSFIGTYWGYVRDTYWLPGEGSTLSAYYRWLRLSLKWHWLVRQNTTDNPFYFSPQLEQNYWFVRP